MRAEKNQSATKSGPGRTHKQGDGSRTPRQRASRNGGLTVVKGRVSAITRDMRPRLSGTKGLN